MKALPFLLLLILACQPKENLPEGDFDILITNGQIVDGSGSSAYLADILINGDSISYIGKVDLSRIAAERTIDATGKHITPGFIDLHAHGNPLNNPDFSNFLAMGVTSIILGQDGFSGSTSDLSTWFDQIDSISTGVNIGTFVGHSTLRRLSGTNYDSVPSLEDFGTMKSILKNSMQQGALGLSTGLEYTPGTFAQADELHQLAEVVGNNGGIVMSHMRNEDDAFMESSIRELLEQGRYCPVHISHIKVVYGKGQARANELLALLDSARKSGLTITADQYPYNASYTGIAIVYPSWAKPPNNFELVLKTRKAELLSFLEKRVIQRNGPSSTLIGSGSWQGMTLQDVADSLDKPFPEVLIEHFPPESVSGAYFVMDKELQEALLLDSLTTVASDGSPTMHHPRGYGSFTKVLRQALNNEIGISLEEAVFKMSGLPASIIGIKNRGLLKVGMKADVLVLDTAKVNAPASYQNPLKLATGVEFAFVNGEITIDESQFTSKMNGRILKKE